MEVINEVSKCVAQALDIIKKLNDNDIIEKEELRTCQKLLEQALEKLSNNI